MAALLVGKIALLFALLAPCHTGASTPENVNLFLGESLFVKQDRARLPQHGPAITKTNKFILGESKSQGEPNL